MHTSPKAAGPAAHWLLHESAGRPLAHMGTAWAAQYFSHAATRSLLPPSSPPQEAAPSEARRKKERPERKVFSVEGRIMERGSLPGGAAVNHRARARPQRSGEAASCAAIHARFPALASGVYSLDPDGVGAGAAFDAYCDMTTSGGGWTPLTPRAAW